MHWLRNRWPKGVRQVQLATNYYSSSLQVVPWAVSQLWGAGAPNQDAHTHKIIASHSSTVPTDEKLAVLAPCLEKKSWDANFIEENTADESEY